MSPLLPDYPSIKPGNVKHEQTKAFNYLIMLHDSDPPHQSNDKGVSNQTFHVAFVLVNDPFKHRRSPRNTVGNSPACGLGNARHSASSMQLGRGPSTLRHVVPSYWLRPRAPSLLAGGWQSMRPSPPVPLPYTSVCLLNLPAIIAGRS